MLQLGAAGDRAFVGANETTAVCFTTRVYNLETVEQSLGR